MIGAIVEEQWPSVLALLPADLDETAKATQAIMRKRSVKSAAELLRLALAYGSYGLSLRETSAWAKNCGVATLSDVALLKRLRKCGDWLSLLITRELTQRTPFPELTCSFRLRIANSVCVEAPGKRGDWQLHVGFKPGAKCIDEIKFTCSGADESRRCLRVQPGDVLLGDRNYRKPESMWPIVSAGGHIVVRLHRYNNAGLLNLDGTPFDVLEHVRSLPAARPGDWPVATAPREACEMGSLMGRLVTYKKSPEAAKRERERLRESFEKKGKTPDQSVLESAGYVTLFTTLTTHQASAGEVLDLNRFRLRFEAAFKKLGSSVRIADVDAHSDELRRTFILSKLLAVLLEEDLGRATSPREPS